MSSVCHSYVLAFHPYVTRMYWYVIRMSHVCTRMSSVCHSCVIRMYSYVIRMSLVCTRMSSVWHSYIRVYHPYVTRMWFYHEPHKKASSPFYHINIFDRKCKTPYGCITFNFYQKYFYEKTDLRHFYFRATIWTVISYTFHAKLLS